MYNGTLPDEHERQHPHRCAGLKRRAERNDYRDTELLKNTK